jgi:AcrR family transcriptional regulator
MNAQDAGGDFSKPPSLWYCLKVQTDRSVLAEGTTMEKADKRERILEAAEKLFKHRRFHEITLQEIAQAAKVGKGTIYLYFEDKDDLFFQVATSGFDELCEVVERRGAPDAPFMERLLAMCEEVSPSLSDASRCLTSFRRRRRGCRAARRAS